MQKPKNIAAILTSLLVVPFSGVAQERSEGTAVIRVSDDEYTIPIECDDPAQPGLGFSTEPARITRQTKGRASMVRDNMPVALTYDTWKGGDRPPGLEGVQFEANCGFRDPEAPAHRRLPSPGAP